MQNCPLLDICKKEPIHISWKGSEECFSRNRKNLDLAFGGGSLSWKRDSQKGTYPLHIRYKPKFLPFTDKVTGGNIHLGNYESAYLHLFFVYPLNSEDYRYNIRPVVSEWFAKINDIQNVQWIIIFDSSRAKEKKIRNAIWEKLRSDFAKYANRLIEISDSSNATEKNSFFSLIQSSLMVSFNMFVNNLQSDIQRLKNLDSNEPFLLPKIVNLVCKLCLFYWNLGLIENALHELDDVDRFLTSALSRDHGDEKNKWVKWARLCPFGDSCHYLGVLMRKNAVDEPTASLAELRAFILAHQILLTFHMFYQRYVVMVGSSGGTMSVLFGENLVESSEVLKQDGENGEQSLTKMNGNHSTDEELLESTNEMSFQLCQNFVSFIWRYTHDAISHLIEDLAVTNAKYSPTMLYITILIWYDEILSCCNLLGDILRMENASYFICQMTFLWCNALRNLLPVFSNPKTNFNDLTVVRQWFEKSIIGERCEPSTTTFGYLNSILFVSAEERVNTVAGESFRETVLKKLSDSARIFRNFGYYRHLEVINLNVIELARDFDSRISFDAMFENYTISLNGKSLYPVSFWASKMVDSYSKTLTKYPAMLFECHLILAMADVKSLAKFIKFIDSSTEKYIRSNNKWNLPQRFPWRITAISNSFVHCDLHKKINFHIKVEGELLAATSGIGQDWFKYAKVKAGLKLLLAENMRSSYSLFSCSGTIAATDQNKRERSFCYSSANSDAPNIEELLASGSTNELTEEKLTAQISESRVFYLHAVSGKRISSHTYELEFLGEANKPGCFILDHLVINYFNNCIFYLNYEATICQSAKLGPQLCFVSTKHPKVNIAEFNKTDDCLLAGVAQKLKLELNAGTSATEIPTEVNVSFVGAKPLMQFLSQDGVTWNRSLKFTIPNMRSEEVIRKDLTLCLDIDRMNFSVDQSLTLRYDLKIDWLNKTWYFPLNFMPIVSSKSMTSQLGDRVLFEVDLQRCDSVESLIILPEQAILLQDQSVAKLPVEAALLNPTPFQPIHANSSYRFVWQLPNSKISKSIPITHFIKLAYSIQVDSKKENDLSISPFMPLRSAIERKYLFENKLTFAIQKVEYEVCAHILSERPQSVLCRVDVPCDLIVSLRLLTSGVPESIIVVVEVDPLFWTAIDKFKVVHIKGSGIGQTSFSIIPKQIGYLPYPNIFVHRHVNANQNDRHSFNETTFIGERLNSFHRNQGKQIHVLAQLQSSDDTSSISSVNTLNSTSTKKSLKSQAKDKIQKLFE